MVRSRLQPHHAPTAAWDEEQRINRLQRVVDFAAGKCDLKDLDVALDSTVPSRDARMAPTAEALARFRSDLESVLIGIAKNEKVALPVEELPRLYITAHQDGLRYSIHKDPENPLPCYTDGMERRWRAIEKLLDERCWRVRICAWEKCQRRLRLFLRRGRSDYCELKHAAAAARARRKQRRMQTDEGEKSNGQGV
jgi:hypothetical protein